jgi:hypothetical protein
VLEDLGDLDGELPLAEHVDSPFQQALNLLVGEADHFLSVFGPVFCGGPMCLQHRFWNALPRFRAALYNPPEARAQAFLVLCFLASARMRSSVQRNSGPIM